MCDYRKEIENLMNENRNEVESFYDYSLNQILGFRKKQEDSICCLQNSNKILAILCDGIGGLENGNLASSLCVYEMANRYLQRKNENNIQDFLHDTYIYLDREIYKCQSKMGTTMVTAFIENYKLYFSSVGDSSLIIIRNNKMYNLLRKHTYELYLNYLRKEKRISDKELMEQSINTETLISFIGRGVLNIIDINEKPYQMYKDDIVILCSDGVTNSISEKELITIISEYRHLSAYKIVEKVFNLISSKKNKIQDNASIILIKVR